MHYDTVQSTHMRCPIYPNKYPETPNTYPKHPNQNNDTSQIPRTCGIAIQSRDNLQYGDPTLTELRNDTLRFKSPNSPTPSHVEAKPNPTLSYHPF